MAAVTIAVGFGPGHARAGTREVLDPAFPQTNGAVHAQLLSGDTLYIGGEFTHVGCITMAGTAAVNISSGSIDPDRVQVDGRVFAQCPDGDGGCFAVGSFVNAGGTPHHYAVHILANGQLAAWDPAVNGNVEAIAISGPTVFLGGSFTTAQGLDHPYLVAVDRESGVPRPWNISANNEVLSLVEINGRIFVGGTFSTLGGLTRNRLGSLNASDGSVDPWNPALSGSIVWSLAAVESTLIVGGNFASVGGIAHRNLAAIEMKTGLPLSWQPDPDATVFATAVIGDRLYAGGDFAVTSNQPRRFVAAFGLPAGDLVNWAPDVDSRVQAIAGSPGGVCLGGQFRYVMGKEHRYFAEINSQTGTLTTLDPGPNGLIRSLVTSGDKLWMGGDFTVLGGVRRNRLAALRASSGELLDWNPDADYWVMGLAKSGTVLYAGGGFGRVGGERHVCAAAIDAQTGTVLPVNLDANSTVYAVTAVARRIFFGGTFSSFGGVPHAAIAAVDSATASLAAWQCDADRVYALTSMGNSLVVGGAFSALAGQPHLRLGLVDVSDGSARPESIDLDENGEVLALHAAGGTLYVGGNFTKVKSADRVRFAALDSTGWVVKPLRIDIDGQVNAIGHLESSTGPRVYVGGKFNFAGNLANPRLVAIDPDAGGLAAWQPTLQGAEVRSLACGNGSVFIGGYVGRVEGKLQLGIGRVFDPDVFPPITLEVPTPGDGEALTIGTLVTLHWNAAGGVGGVRQVDLDLSRVPSGGSWERLATGLPNLGQFDWLVTGPTADSCVLRVTAHDDLGASAAGLSAATFLIADTPTPTFVEFFRARRTSEGVLVEWKLGQRATSMRVDVQRESVPGGGFVTVDAPVRSNFDGDRVLDSESALGQRLRYRLALTKTDGSLWYSDGIDVDAAPFAELELRPPLVDAVSGSISFTYHVTTGGTARLSLIDAQGRVCWTSSVLDFGPGLHSLSVPARVVAPGFYFARLAVGARSVNRRLTVLR